MKKEKLFVLRKYVFARSAKEAIKRESKKEVDDIWVDDEWKKNNTDSESNKKLGF